MKQDLWSNHWQKFQQDDQSILKHTAVSGDFAEESYQVIKRHIQKNYQRVLEVGCGTGRFIIQLAQDFPDIHFEGSDISPESIKLAQTGANLRKIKNISFQVDNMLKLRPRHKAYDLVFNEGSIEHFRGNQDFQVLRLLLKLVRPNGALLFGVPNYRSYLHTITKALSLGLYKYGYERSYKREELQSYLRQLGLAGTQVQGIGFSHGWRRYGFPFNKVANRYNRIKQQDPAQAAKLNDKYGFFIYASGVKKE